MTSLDTLAATLQTFEQEAANDYTMLVISHDNGHGLGIRTDGTNIIIECFDNKTTVATVTLDQPVATLETALWLQACLTVTQQEETDD